MRNYLYFILSKGNHEVLFHDDLYLEEQTSYDWETRKQEARKQCSLMEEEAGKEGRQEVKWQKGLNKRQIPFRLQRNLGLSVWCPLYLQTVCSCSCCQAVNAPSLQPRRSVYCKNNERGRQNERQTQEIHATLTTEADTREQVFSLTVKGKKKRKEGIPLIPLPTSCNM